MIRTIIKPSSQDISIHIPEDFVGKKVEVIVFKLEEATKEDNVLDEPFIHYASEKSLAKEWLTVEEDKAWENL